MITARNRLFVAYYLSTAAGNAKEAARLAGYSDPDSFASKLMARREVQALIDAQLNDAGAPKSAVLSNLGDIAFGNFGNLIVVDPKDPEGKRWDIDIPRAKRLNRLGVVKKLKLKRETRWEKTGKCDAAGHEIKEQVVTDYVEVEMYDRLAALDKLARYHGLFKDRIEVDQKPHVTPDGISPAMQAALEAFGYVKRDGDPVGEREPGPLRGPGERGEMEVRGGEAPPAPE